MLKCVRYQAFICKCIHRDAICPVDVLHPAIGDLFSTCCHRQIPPKLAGRAPGGRTPSLPRKGHCTHKEKSMKF